MNIYRKIMPPFLLIAIVLLSGCATNASVINMVMRTPPNKKLVSQSLKKNISLKDVSGGHETNPLWTPKINNEGFKEALKYSLMAVNLYGDPSSLYQLDAKLLKLEQPLIGINMTVTCMVQYTLTEMKTGKILYTKIITTPYTAKFSDDLLAVMRLRDANEGAARENITAFIKDLYSLRIKSSIHV